MKVFNVFPETIFSIGRVQVTDTVTTTWFVMAAIITICYLSTRKLSIKPSFFQEVLEAIFEFMEKTIKDVLPLNPWLVVPILGTIWILIGFSNMAGLIPGLKTPTADLNTTLAFALISFSMTHVIGIATQGV